MLVLVVLLLLATALESHQRNQCVLVSKNLFPKSTDQTSRNCSDSNNRDRDQSDNTTLLLVPYESKLHYELLISYHEKVFGNTTCDKIIGVIGDFNAETADIINTVASRYQFNVTLVATQVNPSLLNFSFPQIFYFNPLEHYIQAVISLTHHLSWTRVGLISDFSSYNQYSANLLQEKLFTTFERFAVPFLIETGDTFTDTFARIIEYGTHIMIISMKKKAACSLLEEAVKRKFIWPKFGWIVLDTESHFSKNFYCNMEGVLLIQDYYSDHNHVSSSSDETCYKVHTSQNSFYFLECMPSILHDSLKIISLVHKDRSAGNFSYMGATGLVQFGNGKRLSNITIAQIRSRSKLQIAKYISESEQLMFTSDLLETGATPRGDIEVLYNQSTVFHNILVVTITFFCFVFITVIFILYIIFRKEREIKATSVTVSISMFVGSYLMVLFAPLLLVKSYPQSRVAIPHTVTCNFLAWLSGTGFPFILILATIFVKMLRIYAIFQDPFSFKKKLFSDSFLLLYIVLIVSPAIVILIFWSATDPLVNSDIVIETKSQVTVLEYCRGAHTLVWVVLLLLYISILILAVTVIAVKTSKIRYKHFQDAKATNAFAFVTITVLILGIFYWYYHVALLQPSAGNYKSGDVALNVSFLTTAMACHLFLFLPKVYIPTKRWLFQKNCIAK